MIFRTCKSFFLPQKQPEIIFCGSKSFQKNHFQMEMFFLAQEIIISKTNEPHMLKTFRKNMQDLESNEA